MFSKRKSVILQTVTRLSGVPKGSCCTMQTDLIENNGSERENTKTCKKNKISLNKIMLKGLQIKYNMDTAFRFIHCEKSYL